jgi:cytidyltransferase-like protein
MAAHPKIKSLDELASILDDERAAGRSVVQCHGVFDLLHIGHIRHFAEAATLGDCLVVTITPDRHVNKGPGRPVFSEDLRAEAVASLDSVKYVAINCWPQATEAITRLRPRVYVKGSDYRDAEKDVTGGIALEEQAVRAVGGRIAFTDGITFSSSALLNRHMAARPAELSQYLDHFTARYGDGDVVRKYLDGAAALRVLVVGETIIDDYHYCETMGKSGKEPILAARYVSSERFAGGVLAVANHLSSFAGRVQLLTGLGAQDSHEEFVRERLDARVEPTFLTLPDAPTIVKRRYVETYPLQKLFEVYVMGERHGGNGHSEALCERLEALMPECDLVLVTDYGHGLLGPQELELLCAKAPFLAVNTQVNAANHGFNTVSKYKCADFVSVSENEIKLDARSTRRDLRDIVLERCEQMHCDRMIVTQGKQGSLCYSRDEGFVQVPALASHVVDRVGAGDAVFAITSLCAAQKAPMEVVGVIGNAVGAQAVMIVGNRTAVDRATVTKHLTALLR